MPPPINCNARDVYSSNCEAVEVYLDCCHVYCFAWRGLFESVLVAKGQFLCFDDSKTHRAFNYSQQERIVLILDLARPEHLPLGTATGGHTDELDQFIASMNL